MLLFLQLKESGLFALVVHRLAIGALPGILDSAISFIPWENFLWLSILYYSFKRCHPNPVLRVLLFSSNALVALETFLRPLL